MGWELSSVMRGWNKENGMGTEEEKSQIEGGVVKGNGNSWEHRRQEEEGVVEGVVKGSERG